MKKSFSYFPSCTGQPEQGQPQRRQQRRKSRTIFRHRVSDPSPEPGLEAGAEGARFDRAEDRRRRKVVGGVDDDDDADGGIGQAAPDDGQRRPPTLEGLALGLEWRPGP